MNEHWTEEELIFSPEKFYSALCNDITHAKETVWLQTYIFERDPVGRSILKTMAEAALRGVQVRLLMDGFGSLRWTGSDIQTLESVKIEARIFQPMPWQSRLFHWSWNILARLNRRHHSKVCIIDGETAYVGGMNISQDHKLWRDTTARVKGPAVGSLRKSFEYSWRRIRKRQFVPMPTHLVRTNIRKSDRKHNHLLLISEIASARTRVWITTPYFVPDLKLIRSLKSAAQSGADVRLLLPKKSDVLFMAMANRLFLPTLARAGVRIFEYRRAQLHAKTAILDNWALVGSSNLNHRSFLHDLETDIILNHPGSVKTLANQFALDLTFSREIRRLKKNLITRFFESMLKRAKRWL